MYRLPADLRNTDITNLMISNISDSSSQDSEIKPLHPLPPDADRLFEAVCLRISQEPARVRSDLSGCVTDINPAFSGLCGYSFEEIRGRKPGSLLQGPETTHASVLALREAIATQQCCSVEMINYHKNKSTYRVQIEFSPWYNDLGEVIGFEALEWRF